MDQFTDIRSSGKIAMKLDENQSLIGVALCNSHDDILLSTYNGKCIRFPVDKLRVFHEELLQEEEVKVSELPTEIQGRIRGFNLMRKKLEKNPDDEKLFLQLQKQAVKLGDEVQNFIENDYDDDDSDDDNDDNDDNDDKSDSKSKGDKPASICALRSRSDRTPATASSCQRSIASRAARSSSWRRRARPQARMSALRY
jgi:hypothetical protein